MLVLRANRPLTSEQIHMVKTELKAAMRRRRPVVVVDSTFDVHVVPDKWRAKRGPTPRWVRPLGVRIAAHSER